MQKPKENLLRLLDNQEFRIYQLLKLNYPNKIICEKLNLSKNIVAVNANSIYKKLGVTSRIDLMYSKYEKRRRVKKSDNKTMKKLDDCINKEQVMRYRFLKLCGFSAKISQKHMSRIRFSELLKSNKIEYIKKESGYIKI